MNVIVEKNKTYGDILYEALSTHYITDLQRYSLIDSIITLRPSAEDVAKFVVCSNIQLYVGRFSFTFNNTIDFIASTSPIDKTRLGQIISSPVDKLIPELFENDSVDDYHKRLFVSRYNFEYAGVFNAISSTSVGSPRFFGDGGMYEKCYNNVCLIEGESFPLPKPSTKIIVGQSVGVVTMKLELPYMETIEALARGLNRLPSTKTELNYDTVMLLNRKFFLEIEMTKRYLSS